MGVSAHLQDSNALPRVGHSAGLVTVEYRKPRITSSSSYLSLLPIELSRLLLLLYVQYNAHTWCPLLYSGWSLRMNHPAWIQCIIPIPFTLLALNRIVHLKMASTDLVRLGISIVCYYLINECRKLIFKKSLGWHWGPEKTMRKGMCLFENNFST